MIDKEGKKTTKTTWLAFVENETTADKLNDLGKKSNVNFIVNYGNISQAIEYMTNDNSAKHLLIDLTGEKDVEKKLTALGEHCQAETTLIAMGKEDNIKFYRMLKKIGVDEYFTLPLDTKLLFDAIDKFTSKTEATDIQSQNPLITVMGVRGGLGSTTLATNLSWLFAAEYKASVCFMDMDLYYGSSTLSMNIDSNQGLIQALINADRLDDVFLKRLTVEHQKNFFVLAAEQPLDQPVGYETSSITDLTNLIRQNFDYSVIDLPHNYSLIDNPILSTTSHIVLLADFSITSIRDTVKLLQLINTQAPFAKTSIVVLKNTQAKASEITPVQFEEGIKQSIDFILPFDRNITLGALNIGKLVSVFKPNNKITCSIREIANSIAPTSSTMKMTLWQKFCKIGK